MQGITFTHKERPDLGGYIVTARYFSILKQKEMYAKTLSDSKERGERDILRHIKDDVAP